MAPLPPPCLLCSETVSRGSACFQQNQTPLTAGIFIPSISHSAHPTLHQLSFFHQSSLNLGDVEMGIVTHRGADITAADGRMWICALY